MEKIDYTNMIGFSIQMGKDWANDNYPAAMPEDGGMVDQRVYAQAAIEWAATLNAASEAVRALLMHYFIQGALESSKNLLEVWRSEKSGFDPLEVMAFRPYILSGEQHTSGGVPVREFTVIIDAEYHTNDPVINERTEQEALEYCKKYFWWVMDAGQREGDTYVVRWDDAELMQRATISTTESFYQAVSDYRYESKLKSWSQGVLKLAAIGLEAVTGRTSPKAYGEWGGRRD